MCACVADGIHFIILYSVWSASQSGTARTNDADNGVDDGTANKINEFNSDGVIKLHQKQLSFFPSNETSVYVFSIVGRNSI